MQQYTTDDPKIITMPLRKTAGYYRLEAAIEKMREELDRLDQEEREMGREHDVPGTLNGNKPFSILK